MVGSFACLLTLRSRLIKRQSHRISFCETLRHTAFNKAFQRKVSNSLIVSRRPRIARWKNPCSLKILSMRFIPTYFGASLHHLELSQWEVLFCLKMKSVTCRVAIKVHHGNRACVSFCDPQPSLIKFGYSFKANESFPTSQTHVMDCLEIYVRLTSPPEPWLMGRVRMSSQLNRMKLKAPSSRIRTSK